MKLSPPRSPRVGGGGGGGNGVQEGKGEEGRKEGRKNKRSVQDERGALEADAPLQLPERERERERREHHPQIRLGLFIAADLQGLQLFFSQIQAQKRNYLTKKVHLLVNIDIFFCYCAQIL